MTSKIYSLSREYFLELKNHLQMLYKNYLAQQSGKNKGNGLDGHMGKVRDYSLHPSNFLTVKIYHLDFWGSLSMS